MQVLLCHYGVLPQIKRRAGNDCHDGRGIITFRYRDVRLDMGMQGKCGSAATEAKELAEITLHFSEKGGD